jgi:hypothetical protein
VVLAVFPAFGANVALFSDNVYIDYDPTFTNTAADGSNLHQSLVSLGHTVTAFTGVTTAAWTTALAGADVLVMPEQENAAVFPALEAGAVTAIQNFVNGGGALLTADDYQGFLNGVFGFSLSQPSNSGPWLLTSNAAGTSFAGGPASLPRNNATDDYAISSLPSGSLCMYDVAAGIPGCAVFVTPQGSGWIGVLSFDWYNAAPVGSQDGGWIEVLGRTMDFIAQPQAIPTMNEWGMIIFAVLAGIGSVYYIRKRYSA